METKAKKKGMKSYVKIIITVFVSIICVALISGGVYINWLLGNLNIDTEEVTYTLRPETPDPHYETEGTFDSDPINYSGAPQFSWMPKTNKNIINILLIGADKRPTEYDTGRSDSIIIATLDKEHKKIKLTSIMRDTYVFKPEGFRDNKINSAYRDGGPQYLINTINANFNTSLSKYVVVDFEAFEKVVDILGGVDIELNKAEVNYFKKTLTHLGSGIYNLKEGNNHLNGKYALEYARIRHVGNSDYERTDRQRRLLTSIYKKTMTKGLPAINKIAEEVFPHISTNVSKNDILALIWDGFTMGNMEVEELRIPYKNTFTEETRRGMSVLIPDIQVNAEKIRDFIYE